jgi:hypothetical protein
MPVEGLAIYAAATGSLAAINILKSWVQELLQLHREVASAEQTLNALTLSCGASQATLQRWMDMWGIHDNIGKHYPRGLWGTETSIVVLDHLKSLRKLHEETQAILLPARTTEKWESLKTVTSVAPIITAKQKHISEQMATIIQHSEEAFEHRHHMKISIHEANVTIPKAQQRIFFDVAYSSRALWRGMYDSCRQAKAEFESEDLKVELDVFRQSLDPARQVGQMMTPIRLTYAIMFPSVHGIELNEFNVEGPLPLPPNPNHKTSESFHGACLNARISSGRQFFRLQVETGPDSEWFESSVPHPTMRIFTNGSEDSKELKKMLYDLRTSITQQPADIFPLSERIHFGFKVAECGFFLCGTSWLAELKSSNVASVRDCNRNRRFLLETKASVSGPLADDNLRQFNSQAFAIGMLLVEVAIGRIMTRLTTADKKTGHMFQIEDPQNPQRPKKTVSADQAASMAALSMGKDFAGSVRACLYPTKTWARPPPLVADGRVEEGHQNALQEYYFKVYSP